MTEILTVAYGKGSGMGEQKKDHAVTLEEFDKGNEGRTLCGRPLGRHHFPRHTSGGGFRFMNAYSFECSICRRITTRMRSA